MPGRRLKKMPNELQKVSTYLESLLENKYESFDFTFKGIQFKSLEEGILFISPEKKNQNKKELGLPF